MLKLISLKHSARVTFIALKLQISFCQDSDSWQNIGERPYVYKRSSIQTRWHELFQPATMDVFQLEYDFVHVRAFTNFSAYFYVLENFHRKFAKFVAPPTDGTAKCLVHYKERLVL